MKSKIIKSRSKNESKKKETVAIIVAIFIIFVTLLDPLLSAGIAIGALGTVLIYELYLKNN